VNPIIRRGLQDRYASLVLEGKSDTAIMKELGVSRDAIVSYRKVKPKALQSLELDRLKGPLRLEINQENALSELSLQMADYTKEYQATSFPEDRQKWGLLRLRCLENMLKVTGLDKGIPPTPNAEKNTITVQWISTRQIPQIPEGQTDKSLMTQVKNEQTNGLKGC
jgi:hypothetical protein